jgi:hypothetical protein
MSFNKNIRSSLILHSVLRMSELSENLFRNNYHLLGQYLDMVHSITLKSENYISEVYEITKNN